MEINSKNLFLRSAYVYDISACHYQILESFGFDLSDIDKNDKITRNIKIGMMMRDNQKLVELLRGTTERTISEIITSNDLKENEIILRQYDGIIITKTIKNINVSLDIGLRHIYEPMIISFNRSSYITITNEKEIIAKGISNLYPGILKFYKKLLEINYLSKKSIFESLEKIKNLILKSEDLSDFSIPNDKMQDLYLLGYGKISLSKSSLVMVDIDDIDRQFYYDMYLKQFIKSIVLTFS